MSRIRPTFAEMFGFREVSQTDVTKNGEIPLSKSPLRRDLVKRFHTLDELGEPNVFGENGVTDAELDDDDDALLDVVEDAAFVNSQVDPTQDCPSTLNPNRFVAQNTVRKKRG